MKNYIFSCGPPSNGGYVGGKSDNVTTVTGTVAMGLVVVAVAVAKARMMTLCQCTRVKSQVAAAVAAGAAVAAVDSKDGMQWRRWWVRSMAKSAAR